MWYNCINQAWRENNSSFTDSLTTPRILQSSMSTSQSSVEEVRIRVLCDVKGVELDPELSITMCKLQECTNQNDIKTYLMDIEAYQNGKPIEVVVTQKALYGVLEESKD